MKCYGFAQQAWEPDNISPTDVFLDTLGEKVASRGQLKRHGTRRDLELFWVVRSLSGRPDRSQELRMKRRNYEISSPSSCVFVLLH